jgi:hypothetical protein
MKFQTITKEQIEEKIRRKLSYGEMCVELNTNYTRLKAHLKKYQLLERVKKYLTKSKRKTNHIYENLIGLTYGHLTIKKIERLGKSKKYKVNAICYCNNCKTENVIKPIKNILIGDTRSCGCMRDQYQLIRGQNNHNFNGYKDIRHSYWKNLVAGARTRSFEFSITIEDVWELYEKQNRRCAITGLPLVFGCVSHAKEKSKNFIETTASVDRIDNNLGYTRENIQIIHKDINRMRGSLTMEKFKDYCRLVSKETRTHDSH